MFTSKDLALEVRRFFFEHGYNSSSISVDEKSGEVDILDRLSVSFSVNSNTSFGVVVNLNSPYLDGVYPSFMADLPNFYRMHARGAQEQYSSSVRLIKDSKLEEKKGGFVWSCAPAVDDVQSVFKIVYDSCIRPALHSVISAPR